MAVAQLQNFAPPLHSDSHEQLKVKD